MVQISQWRVIVGYLKLAEKILRDKIDNSTKIWYNGQTLQEKTLEAYHTMRRKRILPLFLALGLCGNLVGCQSPDREHEHMAAAWQTVTAPTCTVEGTAKGRCVECDLEMTLDLAKISHTYTAETTPPACESYGYTRYTCACGDTYDGDHLDSLGHTLTQTVIPPTCEKEGYTHYACDCGYAFDADHVLPTGHALTQTVIPPTCETEGYTHYACDCGYAFDADHVLPTGHTLTQTVILPTCEDAGYTRSACECGYAYDRDYVPPLGHTLTETVIPPTCEEAGYTHYECGICDYEREGNPVAPLAHANSTAEVFRASVNRDGYTLHTCRDCGFSYEDHHVRYADMVAGAYVDNTVVLKQGIDTSKWNHPTGATSDDLLPLDWEALKAAGVEFVILKAGSTLGPDPSFEQDYAAAKAAGLEVGAYFYAYSATAEETAADAEMMLGWLEGKQFEYPIYFDLEDKTLAGLEQETLMELCTTFIGRLQEAGYYAALYTNPDWMYHRLDTEWVKSSVDVWFARYVADESDGSSSFTLSDSGFTWKDGTNYIPGEPDKRYGLWQYTQCGNIEGFPYDFDFNYAYKDYKPFLIRWGLNGF